MSSETIYNIYIMLIYSAPLSP